MDEISDFYFRMQNLTKFIGENLKLICQLHVQCITMDIKIQMLTSIDNLMGCLLSGAPLHVYGTRNSQNMS